MANFIYSDQYGEADRVYTEDELGGEVLPILWEYCNLRTPTLRPASPLEVVLHLNKLVSKPIRSNLKSGTDALSNIIPSVLVWFRAWLTMGLN